MAAGEQLKNIGLILSLISIIGGLFNAFGKIIGFYIWILANSLWIVYDWYFKQEYQIPMFIFNLVVCIIGIIVWRKKGR